jgi:hypothetical protein
MTEEIDILIDYEAVFGDGRAPSKENLRRGADVALRDLHWEGFFLHYRLDEWHDHLATLRFLDEFGIPYDSITTAETAQEAADSVHFTFEYHIKENLKAEAVRIIQKEGGRG